MGWGLGPWSEQTGESVTHDFKETWRDIELMILIARYMEKIY